MKFLIVLILAVWVSGCSTCFLKHPLDGKAQSWCEREKRAIKLCKDNEGLQEYYYSYAKCNNGKVFKEELENF